jgi:hypothetical protein
MYPTLSSSHGSYKGVTRVLQGRYKNVTRVLQGCYHISHALFIATRATSGSELHTLLVLREYSRKISNGQQDERLKWTRDKRQETRDKRQEARGKRGTQPFVQQNTSKPHTHDSSCRSATHPASSFSEQHGLPTEGNSVSSTSATTT